MSAKKLKVGDTIQGGSFVLLTSGECSDYGIHGLYRAKADVVIPGRQGLWDKPGDLQPDLAKLSTLLDLEELAYVEVWCE